MGTLILKSPVIFESHSVEETEQIAGDFARKLQPGHVVALDGDLGAGKTQFVRGMVCAMGGNARAVSSPTFVLLHVYQCKSMKVFHLDAYRVTGSDDLEGIGFSELLDQGGVTVVEWAEKVPELLPAKQVTKIRITATGDTSRRIEIVE